MPDGQKPVLTEVTPDVAADLKAFLEGEKQPIYKMSDRPKDWRPADEARFKHWYARVAKQFNLDPNPDDPRHHYNMRMAFKSGAWPNAEGHWPSRYKDALHPNRFVDGEDTTQGDEPTRAGGGMLRIHKAPEDYTEQELSLLPIKDAERIRARAAANDTFGGQLSTGKKKLNFASTAATPQAALAKGYGALLDQPSTATLGERGRAFYGAVGGEVPQAPFARPEDVTTPSREAANRGLALHPLTGLAIDTALDPLNFVGAEGDQLPAYAVKQGVVEAAPRTLADVTRDAMRETPRLAAQHAVPAAAGAVLDEDHPVEGALLGLGASIGARTLDRGLGLDAVARDSREAVAARTAVEDAARRAGTVRPSDTAFVSEFGSPRDVRASSIDSAAAHGGRPPSALSPNEPVDAMKDVAGSYLRYQAEDPAALQKADEMRRSGMQAKEALNDAHPGRGGEIAPDVPDDLTDEERALFAPEPAQEPATTEPPDVYHGTSSDFEDFEVGREGKNSNVLGSWPVKRSGLFFSESEDTARSFASGDKGRVIPARLNIRKPFDMRNGLSDDALEALEAHGLNPGFYGRAQPWEMFDNEEGGKEFVATLKKLGYDGAVFTEPGVGDLPDSTTWVALDPEQVRPHDVTDVARTDMASLSPHARNDIQLDAQGVMPGRERSLDRAINRGDYSLDDVSSAFSDTREQLRAQHGDTMTLYRADAPAAEHAAGTRTVLMADEDTARKFAVNGRKVQAFQVPVDDIVAVHAPTDGYTEFIVKKPEPVTASSELKRFLSDEEGSVKLGSWMKKHLTPAESGKLRKDTAQRMQDIWDELPSSKDYEHAALAGKVKRGWYEASGRAIQDIYGDDAPRFVNLLAALSPRVDVQANLRNAAKMWANWADAGRPTNRKMIEALLLDSVRGGSTGDKVLPSWLNNVVRSLAAEDPGKTVLSGPKVHSFAKNLSGNMREVTNDTWMALFAGHDPDQGTLRLGGSINVKGTEPGKSPAYMAMSAKVRQAADALTKSTGVEWSPAHVQETVWSWVKTLYEQAEHAGMSAREFLKSGKLTSEAIAEAPDFALLFSQDPEVRDILEQAGHGDTLERLAQGSRTGDGSPAAALGGTDSALDRGRAALDRVARRLDVIRDQRRINAAATRAGRRKTRWSSRAAESTGLQESGGLRGSVDGVAEPDSAAGANAEPRLLEGLKPTVKVPGQGEVAVKPLQPAREARQAYMEATGRGDVQPVRQYVPVDEARATKIADEYTKMVHAPDDPEVQAAYHALVDETLAQYQHIKDTGLKIEFIKAGQKNPYDASPRLAIQDVHENNHLWVYPTDDGFGSNADFDASQSPLLASTDEVVDGKRLLANDVFRIVHDYFGHIAEGVGFRADGEENAWRLHSRMFSPEARRALTSETRGQNSWVNYGPHGEANRVATSADTIYADQKTGLLPEWVSQDGVDDPRFVTGQPATMEFLRNTEKSPDMGERFGQHVEPAGRYMIERSPAVKEPPQGWETGSVSFDSPLVLPWGTGGYGDADNWKHVLSQRYDGKTGQALSQAIAKDGYDGIVTLDKDGSTAEVVDLAKFKYTGPQGTNYRVGITSAKSKDNVQLIPNRQVYLEDLPKFEEQLAATPGVSKVVVAPGRGGYEGGWEPTWVTSFKGKDDSAVLAALAQAGAQFNEQDSVLVLRGAVKGAAGTSPMIEILFDKPQNAKAQDQLGEDLVKLGFSGWTWGKRDKRSFLRVAHVPEWTDMSAAEHESLMRNLAHTLKRNGVGNRVRSEKVVPKVIYKKDYDAYIKGTKGGD